MLIRSSAVSFESTSASTSLARNAGSYCSSPRERRQSVISIDIVRARSSGSPVLPQSKFSQHLLAQLRETHTSTLPRVRQINRNFRQNLCRPRT
jgi:hypothetical protein